MTFDYKIIPVIPENIDSPHRIQGYSERKKSVSRRLKKDRRKQTKDRRSGIRQGVIVNLSTKQNRRKGVDRRRTVLSKIVV